MFEFFMTASYCAMCLYKLMSHLYLKTLKHYAFFTIGVQLCWSLLGNDYIIKKRKRKHFFKIVTNQQVRFFFFFNLKKQLTNRPNQLFFSLTFTHIYQKFTLSLKKNPYCFSGNHFICLFMYC